jgi:hypothetical protein
MLRTSVSPIAQLLRLGTLRKRVKVTYSVDDDHILLAETGRSLKHGHLGQCPNITFSSYFFQGSFT